MSKIACLADIIDRVGALTQEPLDAEARAIVEQLNRDIRKELQRQQRQAPRRVTQQ